MDYFIIFGVLIVSIGLAYISRNAFNNEIEKIAKEYYGKLNLEYPDLFGGEYRFYTDNHPYVWGEIPEEEFMGLLKAAATGAYGVPRNSPIFCHAINVKNRCFYFIAGKDKFDFSSRMHCQEWLDSKKELAQNIAKYKNSTK